MPLDERSREEKEAYAQRIMAEMKLKNEKLKERHREVQRDRERAEERNSSITTGRNSKREADKDIAPKAKMEREWDKGKPNLDSDDWDSSKHHDYYSRNNRDYSDRRMKKDDNWRSKSTNASSRPTSSFFSKYHTNRNETIPESSIYRSDTNRYNGRSRAQFHSSNPNKGRSTIDSSHLSYQNSKIHDHSKKFSSSVNYNGFKKEPVQRSVEGGADGLMWQCGSMNEVQHKLKRIENWVESINASQGLTDTNDTIKNKEDYKPEVKCKESGSHLDRPKKYGVFEDSSTKKSFEPSHLKMKEKSHKFNPSFSNSFGRTSRMSTGDRFSSLSDSKNQRDVKRKLNDRSRRNCESDMSDRASSMKESDDFDWGKEKNIRAISNSKSSENSHGRKSGNFKKSESNELSKFERDAWNEVKQEETMKKQTTLRQDYCQDNDKYKYGSKSLPSHDSLENSEPNWEITNNSMKNNELYKNESESGLVSSSRDLNSEEKLVNSAISGSKSLPFQIISESYDSILEKKIEAATLNLRKKIANLLKDEEKECHDLKKHSTDSETKSRSKGFSGEQTVCLEFDSCNSNQNVSKVSSDSDCQIIESSVFENSFLEGDIYKKNMESADNIIALQCNEKECQSTHACKVSGLVSSNRDLNGEEKLMNSAISCPKSHPFQIISESYDSKLEKKIEEATSTLRKKIANILLKDEEKECHDFQNVSKVSSDSDCQIIESSVFENSYLEGDIYKKNMESAENIIALQCNRKECQSFRTRKVSVKRYGHKKALSKKVKVPPKSPHFDKTMKHTEKSSVKNLYMINRRTVSNLDSDLDQNTDEHDVIPVSERKGILFYRKSDISVKTLSDDGWSTVTVTDDEDEIDDCCSTDKK